MPPPATDNGLFQFLRAPGDIVNANGDYSQAPTVFGISAMQGAGAQDIVIARILITLEFYGRELKPEGYGSLGRELSNGIQFRITDGGTPAVILQDFLDGVPIKRHMDWGRYCFDVRESPNTVHARWTATKAKGFEPADSESRSTLILGKNTGKTLEIILNDNFSDLKGHYFNVQGEVG